MAALRSPVRFAQERKNEEARASPLVSIEMVSADELPETHAGVRRLAPREGGRH